MDQYDQKEVFDYLLALRDSGAVNMFGAVPYLEREFGMTKHVATDFLSAWIFSF